MVAFFWGANIGAVLPFVDVVFEGKTMKDYIRDEIKTLSDDKVDLEKKIANLQTEKERPKANKSKIDRQIASARSQIKVKEERLEWRQWLKDPIDRYAPTTPFRTLIGIVIFLMVGTTIKCAFRASSTVLISSVGSQTAADIRNEFFRAVLSDRIRRGDGVGNAAGRISGDVGAIGNAIQSIFGRSIQEPLKMAACLIGAAVVNWRLLIFSLITFPIASLLLIGLAKSIRRASHRSFDQTCMLISRMMQTFRGMEVVKAYNMESHERRRFWEHTQKVCREQVKIAFYGGLVRANNEMLGIGALCLSVVAGGHLVLEQRVDLFGIPLAAHPMTPGEIVVFFAFLVGCTDPMRKLGDVYGTIQSGAAAADRLIPTIDQLNQREETPGIGLPASTARHNIVFENLHFHYLPAQPVIRGLDLEIRNGETLAIIGPNGCGKSTLIRLLLRFLDPVKGQILLDDVDIRSIRRKDLRKRLALVTQRPVLFNDTVANNIRYGSRSASQLEVVSAAKRAHAHEFILESLVNGYETMCGEFGGNLSGGQQQRISLARAILRDPDILILDEASSQIDPKSEQLIRDSLQEFTATRTTIMITHRMATLSLADRILVMDSGKVVDIGTHD